MALVQCFHPMHVGNTSFVVTTVMTPECFYCSKEAFFPFRGRLACSLGCCGTKSREDRARIILVESSDTEEWVVVAQCFTPVRHRKVWVEFLC